MAMVSAMDSRLSIREIRDYKGAVNGLQVENTSARIRRVCAAVDASPRILERAMSEPETLLLVHHGLFWGPSTPWVGGRFERMAKMVENQLAVYSAHLPLDCHPEIGNNALLAAAIGLREGTPFFETEYGAIGLAFDSGQRRRSDLEAALTTALEGPVTSAPFGPELMCRVGVVTGGAGSELAMAAAEGVDTFITGEGPHWTYPLAQELGVNVFYGGHYATETFGVKALAEEISRRYDLPWSFLDDPSGL